MPGLQALPVDVVANVALYLWSSRTDSGDWQYGDRDQSGPELHVLRCVCRAGEDAVRRAVKQHVRIDEVRLYLLGAKAIAAKGRVYGGGCKSLIYCSNGFQFEAVNALRTFVANTQGHLRQSISARAIRLGRCWPWTCVALVQSSRGSLPHGAMLTGSRAWMLMHSQRSWVVRARRSSQSHSGSQGGHSPSSKKAGAPVSSLNMKSSK